MTEPLTDAELIEMRVRANSANIYGPRSYAWLSRYVLRLVAEVERLRAREAVMREIAQAVAATRQRYADDCLWCGEQGDEGLRHTVDCPVSKARAILGEEGE